MSHFETDSRSKITPIEVAWKYTMYHECSICFEYVRRQKIAVMRCCDFKLCKDCLFEWCSRSMSCPHCRKCIRSIRGCHKQLSSKCCVILETSYNNTILSSSLSLSGPSASALATAGGSGSRVCFG